MAGVPLASCIMPTRNRRRFVGQAIWYFLRQDYPARELIVVDDGDDAVADLIPADPRIRYVRAQASTAGAKRNYACELTNGQFIAHWDDDTWYSPQRLTAQLRELQQAGTEVAALGGLLHYQPLTGRLWQQSKAALHTGTLAYRRELWRAHRFPDRGRDGLSDFIRWMPSGKVAVKDGADLAVAVLHGSGTGRVNPADPCWQPRPFEDLRHVLALDLDFYTALRGDGGLAGPRHTLAPITVAATFMVYDGYGSMAEYLAVGMARAGADVHIAPFRIDPAAASPEFRELLQRSRPNPEGVVLCHAWWGENLAPFGSAHDLFIKTVWETSRLPEDWPARLNGARAIIVPSDFSARVFRESGVRTPIEVAYEGIDPDVYPYLERPERPGLTTLIVGVLAPRKNFRQAVAAWQAAFADDPDARLILKARFQVDRFVPDDPRIRVIDSNEATRGILHWYRLADILLALGNEGFGLPMVEAMATGLPVVALDAEAQADVVAATGSRPAIHRRPIEDGMGGDASLVLPVKVAAWERVDSPAFGPAGVRALPSVADAARQLRWVADHREQAREMGRAASAWAHTHRNVWDMGPATLAVIERHARTPRPLRRTYAIWAPAGAGSEEIAYHVRNLARSLGQARVHQTPPVIGEAPAAGAVAWRSPVLHIHYAPGLIQDDELARQVQAAQHNGMAVAITEHVVLRGEGDRAQAWEQRADVLIALNPRAADRLRKRWPHKRVEVIPPGCPPWRASRRGSGGRVIALIATSGGLDRSARLGEIARSLAAQLLVVTLPGTGIECREGGNHPGRADRWSAALADDGEGLAQRLSEEADVVVCLDGDNDGNGCLERIALASGVPVLAAPPGPEVSPVVSAYPAVEFDPIYRPDDLAAGLKEVLENPARRTELAGAARAFCGEASWQKIGALHLALWRTLRP